MLKVVLTIAVFAYLLMHVGVSLVTTSLSRIPAKAFIGALFIWGIAVVSAVARWRLLLMAYGANKRPAWADLIQRYLVAMFYNLLPGAVGGDLLRGYATRTFFADNSTARSLSVVFVERVLGLVGLLILAAVAASTTVVARAEILFYSAVGLAAAFTAVAGIAVGRRVAHLVPRPLASIAASLPRIEAPFAFALAVFLSVITHLLVALSGHILLSSLSSSASLAESLTFFPIGTLAAYFPLTIAGAGARDAALVFLFVKTGISEPDILATSIALLACNIVLSSIGGFIQKSTWSAGTPLEASGDTGSSAASVEGDSDIRAARRS